MWRLCSFSVWWALFLAGSVMACGGSNGGTSVCAAGAQGQGKEGCRCFPNATCFAGLACASNLCVSLGSGGSAAASGTGGATGGATGGGEAEGGTTVGGGSSGSGGDLGAAGATGSGGSSGGSGGEPGMAGATATGGQVATGGSSVSGGITGQAGSIGVGGSAGNGNGSGGTGVGGAVGGGGVSGGAGGGATGGVAVGGSGGVVASGGVGGCGTLIDDFEANAGYICRDNGRVGYWFSYADPTSTLWPTGTPSLPSPLDIPRGTSQRALHTTGTFVQYAGIGCFINNIPSVTYNATAYAGVSFYIKGTASAPKLYVQTRATEATIYGGTCPLPALTCSANGAAIVGVQPSSWTLVSIPFSGLTGGYATFNAADVWSIEFQPGPGPFDLWIDDLRFY